MLFSSQTGIGISFQDGVFRAAEVKRLKDKTLSVLRLEEIELESGLMEGGRILDIDKLSLFIKDKLFVRGKGWSGKGVWCVLPESLVFFHLFVFPALLSDSEIAQTLQIQSEEVFPYAASELVFSHELIRRNEKETIVACAAARLGDVAAYENLLQRIGVKSKGCLLPAQALASVFFEATPKDKAYVALYADVDAVVFFWDSLGLRGSLYENIGWGSLYKRLITEESLAPQKADALLKKLRSGKPLTKAEEGFFDQMVVELSKHVVRGVEWYKNQTEISPIEVVMLSTSFPKKWQEALVEQTTKLLPDLRIRFVNGSERFLVKETGKQKTDLSPWVAALGAARLRLHPLPGLLSLSTSDQQMFKGEEQKKGQKYALFIIFAALLMILGFLLWQKYSQSNDPVDLSTDSSQVDQTETTIITEDPIPATEEPITKTFTVNTVPAEGELPGRILETTFDVQVTPKISGTVVDRPATGKVTLTNETDITQTFVATTRLLSADGVLFRLKDATTVPTKGQTEAEVYADVAGVEGEIAPTKFTIPGLSADLQTVIYAESTEKMSGGTSEQLVWSDSLLPIIEAQAMEEARLIGPSKVAELLIPGEVFIPLLAEYKIIAIDNPPKNGEVLVDSLTLTVSVGAKVLVPNISTLPPDEGLLISNNLQSIQVELMSEDKTNARFRTTNTP